MIVSSRPIISQVKDETMPTNVLPIVIISGPVGVGKTSVGGEVSKILVQRAIPHTFVDFDQLRYTFPRPDDDRWNNVLGLENLESIWANCEKAGALNLVISYVVEDASFIADLSKRIPSSTTVVFQLSANLETLHSRIQRRENGSELEWHKNRAGELLDILARQSTPCDHRINTDRKQAIDVAGEIVDEVRWRQ